MVFCFVYKTVEESERFLLGETPYGKFTIGDISYRHFE